MKTIIISGANSYIGARLEAWLNRAQEEYAIRTIDVRGEDWREACWKCDAVVHVAGIVHQREKEEDASLYYRVNRDLVYEVARLAKAAGARQFIYMSSMSVYGLTCGRITPETPLAPTTHYGRSKLAAEALLAGLEDVSFRVAVVRPPMVFGPGCKGNYPRLSRLARRVPLFPQYGAERSMLYVDNLCEALRRIILQGGGGYFFPQDSAYYSVSQIVRQIAAAHGRRVLLVPGFAPVARLLARGSGTLGKVFGSLTYDRAMSDAPGDYRVCSPQDAIVRTETEETR